MLARARTSSSERPDWSGHDTVAWALYRLGRFDEAAVSIASARTRRGRRRTPLPRRRNRAHARGRGERQRDDAFSLGARTCTRSARASRGDQADRGRCSSIDRARSFASTSSGVLTGPRSSASDRSLVMHLVHTHGAALATCAPCMTRECGFDTSRSRPDDAHTWMHICSAHLCDRVTVTADRDLLVQASRLYYELGETQNAVADRLEVTPQVSRLLKRARRASSRSGSSTGTPPNRPPRRFSEGASGSMQFTSRRPSPVPRPHATHRRSARRAGPARHDP